MDSVLIANECVDRVPGIVCKLDLEKAYDHVTISVTYAAELWFSRVVKEMDLFLYLYSLISILVNECPSGFFHSSWGLCQGELQSSLLFVIMMEALSRMLSNAVEGHYIQRLTVGEG